MISEKMRSSVKIGARVLDFWFDMSFGPYGGPNVV